MKSYLSKKALVQANLPISLLSVMIRSCGSNLGKHYAKSSDTWMTLKLRVFQKVFLGEITPFCRWQGSKDEGDPPTSSLYLSIDLIHVLNTTATKIC